MNTGVIVTVLLAFLGFVVTYLNNLRLSQRKERLERVNRQLSELYGPLVGMSRATETAWEAFRKQYRPRAGAYFNPKNPPSKKEIDVYRIWQTAVFIPINLRMYELILS